MKKGVLKNKEIIVLIFYIFIIINIYFLLSQQQTSFNEEKIETWSSNIDRVLSMDVNKRNAILNNVEGKSGRALKDFFTVRGGIIESMAIEFSKRAVQSRKGSDTSISTDVVLERLKGFDSKDLRFKEGNILTDGDIEIDLENLPKGVKEIEYISSDKGGNGELIYRFKEKSEISIATGKLNEDLTYTHEIFLLYLGEKNKIKFEIDGDGKISVDDDGIFKFEDSAVIKFGDKIFEPASILDRRHGELMISNENYFIGRDFKLTTKEEEIKVGLRETDIIFDSRKFSGDRFIQIQDEKGIKKITMKGENIEVTLLKEGLKDENIQINADGRNLAVFNGKGKGKSIWIFDNDRIYTNRAPTQSEVNTEMTNDRLPNQRVNTDIEITDVETPTTPETTQRTKSQSEVKVNDNKRVCIGRFCTIGAKKHGLFGDPYTFEKEFDYQPSSLERLVSETQVYATQSDVAQFITMARENQWSDEQIRLEAARFFTDTQSELTTKRELSWSQLDPKLQETIKSLGLPQSELDNMNKFKLSVISQLPNQRVPVGTRIITANIFTGGKQSSYGTFSLILPDGRVMSHRVPGTYFENARRKNVNKNPYILSEIVDLVRGR